MARGRATLLGPHASLRPRRYAKNIPIGAGIGSSKPSKRFSSMQPANLFQVFTDRLNQLGFEYMVTGSVAGMIYGEPRITHDIDIVLRLVFKDIETLVSAFPAADFYVPPTDLLRVETRRNTRGRWLTTPASNRGGRGSRLIKQEIEESLISFERAPGYRSPRRCRHVFLRNGCRRSDHRASCPQKRRYDGHARPVPCR